MNFLLHSPLEQFEILPLFSVGPLVFTNSALAILLAVGFGLWGLTVLANRATLVPNSWQYLGESLYQFIYGLVSDLLGEEDANKFFPFMITLFVFILFINLMGMVPFSFTATSHFIFSFGLSLTVFLALNIIAFRKHGLGFLMFFVPAGAPAAMVPLLIVIEVISYLMRVVSLFVRLTANMLAGHALLKILAGFSYAMFVAGGIAFYIGGLAPMGVVYILIGLELFVAMIQAYVFTILSTLYLKDALHMH